MNNTEVKDEIKVEPDNFPLAITSAAGSNLPVGPIQSLTPSQLAEHSQLLAQLQPGQKLLLVPPSQSQSQSKSPAQQQVFILQPVPYSQLVANSKSLVKLQTLIQPNSQPGIHLVPSPRQESTGDLKNINLQSVPGSPSLPLKQSLPQSKKVPQLQTVPQTKYLPLKNMLPGRPQVQLKTVPQSKNVPHGYILPATQQVQLQIVPKSKAVGLPCVKTEIQEQLVPSIKTEIQEQSVPSIKTEIKEEPVTCLQTESQKQPVSHIQTNTQMQLLKHLYATTRVQTVPDIITVSQVQTLSHIPTVSQTQTAPITQKSPESQSVPHLEISPKIQPVSLVQSIPQFEVICNTLENPKDKQIVSNEKPTRTSGSNGHLKGKQNEKVDNISIKQEELESKAELRRIIGLEESGLKAECSKEMSQEESKLDPNKASESVKVEIPSESEMEEEEAKNDELSECESIDGDFVVFKDDFDEEEEEEDSKSKKKKRKFPKYSKGEFFSFRYDSDDEEEARHTDSDEDYLPSEDSVDSSDCEIESESDIDCDRRVDLEFNCNRIYGELEPKVVVTPSGEFTCTYCVQVRSTRAEATAHLLTHYEYSCEECGKKLLTPQVLKRHIYVNHTKNPPEEVIHCLLSGCEHMSNSKDALLRHIEMAHADAESFTCAWCSRSSRTVTLFKRHILSSHLSSSRHGSTDRLCESCGMAIGNSKSGKEHLKDCQNIIRKPDSLCQHCGLFVPKLHHHLFTKHTESTIPCKFDGCKTMFKNKYTMMNHYRTTHLGIRKYHCKFEGCNFSSHRKGYFNDHVNMVHLKVRTVPCTWEGCNKSFYQKKHLLVHMRIHSDIKPLSCELCDYTCRQRAAMNWHMNKNHGQGPDPAAGAKKKKMAGDKGSSLKLMDQASRRNTPVGVPASSHALKPGRKAQGKKSKRKNKN